MYRCAQDILLVPSMRTILCWPLPVRMILCTLAATLRRLLGRSCGRSPAKPDAAPSAPKAGKRILLERVAFILAAG